MLLDNKTAIIYGAAGAIGSAVAHAYAREGAEVHLAGRTAAARTQSRHRTFQYRHRSRSADDPPGQRRHPRHGRRPGSHPHLGGSHVAWTTLAGLCRQLAAEFGPHGIRVSWLLSPGSPGYKASDQQPQHPSDADSEPRPAPGTQGLPLHHQPTYEQVAKIATLAASDWARTITASEINITGGAVID